MDYIPILELTAATVGAFICAETIRGLQTGEVHFLVQWLFEPGYKREDVRFKRVVVVNLALAATLFAVAAARFAFH